VVVKVSITNHVDPLDDDVKVVVYVPTRFSFGVVSAEGGLPGEELLAELDGIYTDPVPAPEPVEPFAKKVSVVTTVDPLMMVNVVIIPR
jgi:hypothetical protein